jgi:hypothetical protein
MNREPVFFISLAYLLILLALALLYFVARGLLAFLPDTFGSVPVGVPWFGALGAAIISLTGVIEHGGDWENRTWPWYVARPFIGTSVGVVSVLIVQAGILAVGSTPTPSNGTAVPPTLLYYLVAFLVGYRESTFRDLIRRLTDVLLSPGGESGAVPAINSVIPSTAPHDAGTEVIITGSGLSDTQSVKFGTASAPQLTVNSDGQVTARTPVVDAPGAVPLTVVTKTGSATFQPFTFT